MALSPARSWTSMCPAQQRRILIFAATAATRSTQMLEITCRSGQDTLLRSSAMEASGPQVPMEFCYTWRINCWQSIETLRQGQAQGPILHVASP